MANLTSPSCNKHRLTVIANVHVRLGLKSQPVRASWGKDGCGCGSSLRWHPLASHLPLTLYAGWRERCWWRQTCEGRSPYCLDQPCYWLVQVKKKKERRRRDGEERILLEVSTRDYTGQVKNTMQLQTSGNTAVKHTVHTRTRVTSAVCSTSAISTI